MKVSPFLKQVVQMTVYVFAMVGLVLFLNALNCPVWICSVVAIIESFVFALVLTLRSRSVGY